MKSVSRMLLVFLLSTLAMTGACAHQVGAAGSELSGLPAAGDFSAAHHADAALSTGVALPPRTRAALASSYRLTIAPLDGAIRSLHWHGCRGPKRVATRPHVAPSQTVNREARFALASLAMRNPR